MSKLTLLRYGMYCLFFLSGIAGLIYQIIWTRMLLLTFGSTTHSVVAVLSAFMAGLALGSWGIGVVKKEKLSYLRLYAVLELAIGIFGLASPALFSVMTAFYSAIYGFLPPVLLLPLKFLLTFMVLLPPTTAMGATLPLVIEFLRTRFSGIVGTETSRLYALNTFGAVAGVLATGFILIETIGLRASILTAALINFAIAAIITVWSKKIRMNTKIPVWAEEKTEPQGVQYAREKVMISLGVFAVSGALGMAYEVIWTRLLTPTTGTYIYAFSSILAVLLFGIALGSLIYPFLIRLKLSPFILFGFTEVAIGLGAIGSILATSYVTNLSQITTVLLTIFPASLGMGLTFPIVASLTPPKRTVSDFVGKSYALNTLGSMVGPLAGGFILLPTFGEMHSILLLAFINFLFAVLFFSIEKGKKVRPVVFSGLTAGLVGITAILFLGAVRSDILEERTIHALMQKFVQGQFRWRHAEDETAAVLGFNNGRGDYGLLVDGVGMSVLVDETKLMAHLPLLLHPDPQDTLVICFGMGTTFRSALTYGGNVDAVELVPSVPKMFSLYFADADEVLANPKGHIIINDGRNYVRMTDKRYDVITVDPPPPVNSAGTTVLYSKEFYQQSKHILKPGGLFTEWFFYGTRADDFQYLLRSFTEVFPYVAVYGSPRAIGIYLIGSETPIKADPVLFAKKLQQEKVRSDINEWGYWDDKNIQGLYIGDKSVLLPFIDNAPPVTDDRPRTEYFYLRHKQAGVGIARNEVLFPDK